jgi:hypothetical protein
MNEIACQNREKINALEDAILATLAPAEVETYHHYAHGTYTREMRVKAGTVITGAIHKHSCVNILAAGKIKVITDEGEYDLSAPHVFVSGPDVKKAGLVLEDVVWINVHPWDGVKTLEQIESDTITTEKPLLEAKWLG